MEPVQVIFVAVAVMVGTVVQTAVGFGCALFAVPIMVWSGVELPSAIAIVVAVVLVQTAWSTWQYREHVPWRKTWLLMGLRAASLPVGIWCLGVLVGFGEGRIKQVIGAMLFVALILQWAMKVQPREQVHAGWTVAAGLSSGFTAGLVGMGGPPLVLWVMAHDWPSKQARAFLWATFLQLIPLQIPLLMLKFGPPVGWAFLIGLASLPAALVGGLIGMHIGAKLSRERLRRAGFGLLLLLAIASVVEPMLRDG